MTVPPFPTTITLISPLRWLAAGWADLRRHPLPGLLHGLLIAAFAALLLWGARDRFWLLAGAFSGFLIVAPVLATGLYAVSRGLEQGRRVSLGEIGRLWCSADTRLVRFGLLLGLAGTGWVLTSAALITLYAPQPVQRPQDFLQHVVLAAHPFGLFEAWLLLGGLLAAPMFASSVVAMPLLLDRPVSVGTAVRRSWSAVASHPGPVAVWALLILLLVALGMASALLGLVVLLPLLGHASWHAYRDLTGGGRQER